MRNEKLLQELESFASAAFIVAWLVIFFARKRILDEMTPFPDERVLIGANLSVIVPVRNEEKHVAHCLSSILKAKGVVKEVIVVDDNSTDRTWDVVQQFVGVDVKAVKAGVPPEGWMGKSWACHVGYKNSTGSWLLFTDADTEFSEKAVVNAVADAERRGLEFVSLYPRFRMNSFLHHFALPVMLLGFYAFGKPHLVKKGKSAFAFGSFILVRRDAYERIGGHQAVRDAVLEDRALALAAQKAGLKTELYKAFDQLVTSWNDDSVTLWNGMIRIFTPLALKNPGKTVGIFFLLTFVCLAIPAINIYSGNYLPLVFAHLAAALVVGGESARHQSNFLYGLMWPVGVAAIMTAALVALTKAWKNPTVVWRGRKYLIRQGQVHEQVILVSSDK
ncbi:MAG: glycosyltransferase family 2 protein [Candidatus Caldarchaeum sp.]